MRADGVLAARAVIHRSSQAQIGDASLEPTWCLEVCFDQVTTYNKYALCHTERGDETACRSTDAKEAWPGDDLSDRSRLPPSCRRPAADLLADGDWGRPMRTAYLLFLALLPGFGLEPPRLNPTARRLEGMESHPNLGGSCPGDRVGIGTGLAPAANPLTISPYL
ncbi:hypothetical protein BT67DRAFT_443296 [Trichocladium antarcticum]|uniref:Uncharacterized protein n=1 Tax=Trichocladium antarcticum TaxID=1450529 RepID=A0AAN6UHP8_9PEZI|nr:hypothetical protein BT67DRAFT_443296 [Trichocladium antarcticum]